MTGITIGVSRSAIPDLRDSVKRMGANLDAVALGGLHGTAMPALGDAISESDAALIRGWLQSIAVAKSE